MNEFIKKTLLNQMKKELGKESIVKKCIEEVSDIQRTFIIGYEICVESFLEYKASDFEK